MDSASRSVEITFLNAEDIRLEGKPVKKDAYGVARIDSVNFQSTKADYEGGSRPAWNQKLELNMPMHTRDMALEVHCRVGSSNRLVGTASIPVSDFLGEYMPEGYLHFLSYRLRDAKGQKNGIINVSLRVKGAPIPYAYTTTTKPVTMRKNMPEKACSSSSTSQPQMGVPADGKNHHGRVVTGIPVWCASLA